MAMAAARMLPPLTAVAAAVAALIVPCIMVVPSPVRANEVATEPAPVATAPSAPAPATEAAPAPAPAPDRPSFSHAFHLGDGGAECSNCHDTDSQPGLPLLNRKGCEDCHDAAPDYQYTLPRARRLHVAFPHRTHTGVAACLDCHKPTATETQSEDAPVLARTNCLGCHAESGVVIAASDCARCHGKPMRAVAPETHDDASSWRRRHGEAAQWQFNDEHGRTCTMCHEQRTCDSCHHTSKPADHTGLWRLRTHGSQASWDRDACKTCHETGSCVRCHQTTAPLNHQASWRALHQLVAESRSDPNCGTCHATAWCTACHASGSGGAP